MEEEESIQKRDSLYDISWKVTEPEYRQDKALSYSTISRFQKTGFDGLSTIFDKIESPSLVFGSLVDTLLTGTEEEFKELYFVADFPSIPDSQANIVKYLFEHNHTQYSNLSDIPSTIISDACVLFNFQSNWKSETRVKVIVEKGDEYYNLLFLSVGKTLIGMQMYNDAVECTRILKEHENSREYFEEPFVFDDSIEKFYQLKFKGEYEGIPLRIMADLIIVNHETKTITPCDLKTSYKKEWLFYKSFIEYNYYIQAQLYWYIIRQNLDKHPLYKDYKLADYEFIVISNNSRIPLVWEYPDTKAIVDLTYGKNNNIVLKNWRNIIVDLYDYLTNVYSLPKGIKSKNNIIEWLNNE